MEERGWTVQWEDTRKHIVFQNNDGKKVRDSNLEKSISGLEVSKEALTREFERQNELRISALNAAGGRADDELRQYYAEIESAAAGLYSAETVRNNTKSDRRNSTAYQHDPGNAVTEGQCNLGAGTAEKSGPVFDRSDTEALIRKVKTEISDSRAQSRAVVCTENQSVIDAEQRRLEEQRRSNELRRAKEARRKVSRSRELER